MENPFLVKLVGGLIFVKSMLHSNDAIEVPRGSINPFSRLSFLILYIP